MTNDQIGPSLLAARARVPDMRSHHGRRYPLSALLTLATAAMLAGARSLYAIAQWGRMPPPEVRRALGFPESAMSAATTLHYAFKWLDTTGVEAALHAWAAEALGAADQQVVLDGKALRGIHGEELPGVRLVAVYAPVAGVVLAQAGGQEHRGAG
jgi:DDE family transposase